MTEKYTLIKIVEGNSAKTFFYWPSNDTISKDDLKNKLVEILSIIKNLSSEKIEQLYFFLKTIK